MSPLWGLLLWTVLPAPAVAAPERPPSIEAQLNEAEASITDIERVLKAVRTDPRLAEKACRDSFSVESLSAGLRSLQVPASAFVVLPSLRQGLTSHLACRALAVDDAAACAPLEPLAALPTGAPFTMPPDYVCRTDYYLWSFDRSRLAGGPDLYRRCLEENAHHRPGDEGPFKPGTFENACAVVRDYRAGAMPVAEACLRLKPSFDPPLPAEECARRVRWFFAEDAGLCAGLRSPDARDRCRDLLALRKAVAAGSTEACGDSAPCRLLMSRPPNCARPLEQARAAYCGRYDLGYAWRLHADLSVLLERAADALGGATNPQSAMANPLVDRLARLEARRQDLARDLGQEAPPDKVAPALPGAAFAEVDLDLARGLSLALSRGLAAPPAGCAGGFSVPALLEAIRGGTLTADNSLLKPLEEYFGCQALVLGGPGVCRDLEMPRLNATFFLRPDYLCRHHFLMWRHDLARLSGSPDMAAFCIAENYYRWRAPFDGGPFKPGAFRDGCEIISGYSARGADLREVCGRAMPYYRYSKDVGECVDRFRYAHGEDARLCETLDHPRVKMDRCLDLVALRKAMRAGGADCGDSFYCKMQLDRGPESCGPYLARLREAACRASGGLTDGASSQQPASSELLERAGRRLDALVGVPDSELARRRRVLDWLRKRSAGPR
jgi:hypothetical protein